jgi:hypothetical protein
VKADVERESEEGEKKETKMRYERVGDGHGEEKHRKEKEAAKEKK